MAARSLAAPAWVRAGGGRAHSRPPYRCRASATNYPNVLSSSLSLALRRSPPRTLIHGILHDPSTSSTRRRSVRRHATADDADHQHPPDDTPLAAEELIDSPAAATPASWLPALRSKLAAVRDDPELRSQVDRLARVRKQLVPMSVLFFCMASINTFLDSTKDVLVVTMSGGGAEVRA
jgi:hypothetical protein